MRLFAPAIALNVYFSDTHQVLFRACYEFDKRNPDIGAIVMSVCGNASISPPQTGWMKTASYAIHRYMRDHSLHLHGTDLEGF